MPTLFGPLWAKNWPGDCESLPLGAVYPLLQWGGTFSSMKAGLFFS